MTWSFADGFLRSEKTIVHNRKFVPKREGNGRVHDRVLRIIPGCRRRRHRRCRHYGRRHHREGRRYRGRHHYREGRRYYGRRRYRRNVVVAEAASGALRNRRRKRPPWLLCSESKVLCAFGTALSPTVIVARASIKACLAVERSSMAKACPPAEAAPSSEMSLAAVLCLSIDARMMRRARLPLAPRLPTNAFMSRRTRLLPVKAHPSPAGACLLRSKARAIFAMRWSATQKPPSSSSCRARRPHLTFQ